MKLWNLKLIVKEPWLLYDVCLGFIICAADEESARKIAAKDAYDEGFDAWLDSTRSTCIEFVPTEKEEIIMRDCIAG